MDILSEAKKAYRILCGIQKRMPHSKQGEYAWIYDNMHIIDAAYRSLKNADIKKSDMRFVPKIIAFCNERRFDLTEDEITAFLNANAEYAVFSASEIFALPSLFDACALIKLAYICANGEEYEQSGKCIGLLRLTHSISCDALFEAAYLPEALLTAEEPRYAIFDSETKNRYRLAIHSYALKKHVNDMTAYKQLHSAALSRGISTGILLFDKSNGNAAVYITCCAAAIGAICIMGAKLFGPAVLPCILPVAEAVFAFGDFIMSFMPGKSTLKISLKEIPDDARTAAVITTLLLGPEKDAEIFERLALFAASNRDKNACFCVLADLVDASEKDAEGDESASNYAKMRIDELCKMYGNRFCLYLRERQYAECDGIWRAHERKRGAINEFIRFLHGEKTDGVLYGDADIKNIRYICALDRDTYLPIDGIKELLEAALHPVNAAVVKNGKVVRGYGIMQPAVKTTLESAYNTRFSRLISGEAGGDVYANAVFDRNMALFGEGTFCGKGLIDADVFYKTVLPALPDGRVLSHDIAEGEIAHTLFVPETVFTDSCPADPASFLKRLHRWVRGDVQNLSLITLKALPATGKYKLLANFRRVLLPISACIALLVGAAVTAKHSALYLLFALSHILTPLLISVILTAAGGRAFTLRRYFTRSLSAFSQAVRFALWSYCSAAAYAAVNFDAMTKAFARLISGKKLLEWTTSTQAENKSRESIYSAISFALGILVLLTAKSAIMLFTAAAFTVYPLVSVILSQKLSCGSPSLGDDDKKLLRGKAAEIWRFFEKRINDGTSYLPPDNIQYSPEMRTAMRTSPTNIGFYLVSVLAARDFELIDSNTLAERIIKCLESVSQLKRYKGCLYNWYDLRNMLPLGNYVSSVDCGNMLCCLIALRSGLYEYLGENEKLMAAIDLCTREIEKTDLSIFYNQKRKLFSLGINADDGVADSICYDLYMSEFRLTAYAATALGYADKKSWRALGRTCTSHKGYIGMLSWSGTAFEYFMPSLFLPEYKNSFLTESLEFAYMLQREKSKNGMVGISESGYYAFDSAMNYAYKAHGVRDLALCRYDADTAVYSPYAAYLMLCRKDRDMIAAINAYRDAGMQGEYGLYEANDFTAEKYDGLIVRSYMSHHMGMSMIACANACLDDIFVTRFSSDHRIASSLELLKERVPDGVMLYDNKAARMPYNDALSHHAALPTGNFSLSEPDFTLLCGNGVSAVCDSSGHIRMNFGSSMLNICRFDKYSLFPSAVIRFSCEGEHYGCAPLHGEGRYSGEYGTRYVSQINSSLAFTGKTVIRAGRSRPGFFFETSADNRKKYRVTFCFEPSMDKERDFNSHPAYSRLFIEGRYDGVHNALIFTRRSDEGVKCLVAAPRDKRVAFEYTTSKECLSAYKLCTVEDIDALTPDGREGACINPLCFMRTDDIRGGKTCFIVTAGENEEAALGNLAALRLEVKSSAVNEPTSDILSLCLRKCFMQRPVYLCDEIPRLKIDDLWKHGISGDECLIVLDAVPHSDAALDAWISAYAAMAHGFIRAEMVICTEESDNYNRPLEKYIRRLCNAKGLAGYHGNAKGIIILRGHRKELESLADIYVDLSKLTMPHYDLGYIDCTPEIRCFAGENTGDINTIYNKKIILPTAEGGFLSKGYNGHAGNDGYIIDTSSAPPLPRTFVIANKNGFGAVLTHASAGCTFNGNARENRITYASSDPFCLQNGERLLCRIGSTVYDLCSCSDKVVYYPGHAEYNGRIFGYSYHITVLIHPDINAKITDVRFDDANRFEIAYCIYPCSPDGIDKNTHIAAKRSSIGATEGFMFQNIPQRRDNHSFYVGGEGCCAKCDLAKFVIDQKGGDDCLLLTHAGNGRFIIASGDCDQKQINSLRKADIKTLCAAADDAAEKFIPAIEAKMNSKSFSALMKILPLQAGVCRMLARTSFWQSGGAYGFRDQLQDCMMLAYSVPDTVRAHILNAAAHQYVEGDVMHWWHAGIGGVRTKCSDDMLWLPIATCEYIRITNDREILNEKVPFMISDPLVNCDERYEMPEVSSEQATLREHCARALAVTETGQNGLALMGSCDWNDAFSEMRGESMLTTFIYITAAKMFLPYAADNTDAIFKNIEKLMQAAEKFFVNGRYIRAIAEDGTVYGNDESDECAVDAAVQAFAVFAGAKHGAQAIKTAFDKLCDDDVGIIKLFEPPFDKGETPAGVIRKYPAGIRENGGQYTHAAVWLAMAALSAGLDEIGIKTAEMLDPIAKNSTPEKMRVYKGDPYVLAADIYSAKNSAGRAGWTWYTGSAGWYYKLLLEKVMGICIGGRRISVCPKCEYKCVITQSESTLEIIAEIGNDRAELDGTHIDMPFEMPVGKHTLKVYVNS